MSTISRIDKNFILVSSCFVILSFWFYFIQGEFIESDSVLSPIYRTISHNGTSHLFGNVMSLLISSFLLIFFVTYKFILTSLVFTGIFSYWYYMSATRMAGFSIVTSGLMGTAVTVFLLNTLILTRKERIKKSSGCSVGFNQGRINVQNQRSKIIFTLHLIAFFYSAVPRTTDLLIQSGIIPADYHALPTLILHSRSHIRSQHVTEAHTFGFIAGVMAGIIMLTWIMIFSRKEYEKRIFKLFKEL